MDTFNPRHLFQDGLERCPYSTVGGFAKACVHEQRSFLRPLQYLLDAEKSQREDSSPENMGPESSSSPLPTYMSDGW